MKTLELARLINQRVSDHLAQVLMNHGASISERQIETVLMEAANVGAALIDKYRPLEGPIGGPKNTQELAKAVVSAAILLMVSLDKRRPVSDQLDNTADTVKGLIEDYGRNVRTQVLAEVEASAKAGGDLMAAVMEARK